MKNLKEMTILFVNPNGLNCSRLKKYSGKEVERVAKVLNRFGFQCPVVIDKEFNVVVGDMLVLAAQKLELTKIPIVEIQDLTEKEIRGFTIAINKILDMGEIDLTTLRLEVQDLIGDVDLRISPEELGFTTIELDNLLFDCSLNAEYLESNSETNENLPENVPAIVKTGDLVKLGRHLLYCGDALDCESYKILLGSKKADIVITDPPYNVKIADNVTKQKHHEEFANASGEMTEAEFTQFLGKSFKNLKNFSSDNSIHYIFMDWRHIGEVLSASKNIYPKLLNLCVWNKLNGGMGSFYRSQHEFCFVYQAGTGKHKNNIKKRKNGRNRTNVWDYKGMNTSTRQANKLRKLHPTVKPSAMLGDILLDASEYGDTVLDCFGGSGSTLIAAEQCGRQARLIELSPHYCDVIITRWEELTSKKHEIINKKENING